MHDVVHIDEKWLYIDRAASRFVLVDCEPTPPITTANKLHMTKAMFLVAVARPQYNYARASGFGGKIGVFPIVQKRAAQRTTNTQTRSDQIITPRTVIRSRVSRIA